MTNGGAVAGGPVDGRAADGVVPDPRPLRALLPHPLRPRAGVCMCVCMYVCMYVCIYRHKML